MASLTQIIESTKVLNDLVVEVWILFAAHGEDHGLDFLQNLMHLTNILSNCDSFNES